MYSESGVRLLAVETSKTILLLGATGTIGRATARVLLERGHEVICVVRPASREKAEVACSQTSGGTIEICEIENIGDVMVRDGAPIDAVISCMASRTGAARDAWDVDYHAHMKVLSAAKAAGVRQMVLLSAICVQKPRLAFQKAKLAFEEELAASGLDYSIVRPTAYFKSLSGQVERLKKGKSFVVFGDGELTACKPISDRDLAVFIADCLHKEDRRNKILPIGGPGPALTPREQGEILFELLGRKPVFQKTPIALFDLIVGVLSIGGAVAPPFATKAELARIGRYYATESMLVLDSESGDYRADLTPSTGADTLKEYYKAIISGDIDDDRGDHAVF